MLCIFSLPIGLGPSQIGYLSGSSSSQFISSAVSAPSHNVGLVLSNAIPILPADGGTYSTVIVQFANASTGMPVIPESDTTVELSSSSLQIGSVPSNVTFQGGSAYVSVPFHATTTPGTTNITAVAPGYPPANLQVKTQKTGGLPTALKVVVSPSEVPPDSKLNATVTVEAVDVFGNPVNLASDLAVTVSSSSAQTGSIPSTLTIPAGQSFAETSFTPSYVAGQSVITASAAGYSSGSAVLTTQGPIARRLVVSIAPTLISNVPGESAIVSVQLQDNNSQTPAPAPSDVSLVLTSNNTSIAGLPNPIVTIPAGESYALVTLTAGGGIGVANITASAQGYVKGSALVIAKSPSNSPSELGVFFAPNTLLPNNNTYPGSVVTELLSGTCFPDLQQASQSAQAAARILQHMSCAPATSLSDVTVYARSSNNASMQVDSNPATIPVGATHVAVDMATTYLPGSASITAQSVGLSSVTSNLLSFGLRPNALRVDLSPNRLVSGGSDYNTVFVSLVDLRTGAPAKAPVDTLVKLGANTSVPGTVQSTVIIHAGQTYAQASYSTSGLSGAALITATSSNYTSANATLTLMTPAASRLGLYASPTDIVVGGQSYQNLFVQLQDTSGSPQKTDAPVVVQLSTPSTSYGSVQSSVTIEPGSTFAVATVTSSSTTGKMMVTGFANGYRTAQVTIQSVLLPLSGHLILSQLRVPANTQTPIVIQATSSGVPVQNATIKWVLLSGGKVVSGSSATNANGQATVVYKTGAKLGPALLQAELIKPGYAPTVATSSMNVTSNYSGLFLFWNVFSIPVWVIIVVVGVAASIIFVRRRRQQEDDTTEDYQ